MTLEEITLANNDILRNIKRLGKERKMTLGELSSKIGRKKGYISATFSKKNELVSLQLLMAIASVLKVSIDNLLLEKTGEDTMIPKYVQKYERDQ